MSNKEGVKENVKKKRELERVSIEEGMMENKQGRRSE
jgi:hypothetical protein